MIQKLVSGLAIAAAMASGLLVPGSDAPASSSRCWPSCEACVSRARDGARRADCYDQNASCCEANGQKPIFRSCGCSQ